MPPLVLFWLSDELIQGVKQAKDQSYKKGIKSARCTDCLSHAFLDTAPVRWEWQKYQAKKRPFQWQLGTRSF